MALLEEDYSALGVDISTQQLIAPVLLKMVADRAFAVGDQFICQSTLYKVTTAVTLGTTLTVGTNCVLSDTITQQRNFPGVDVSSTGLIYTFTANDTAVTDYDRGNWTATEDCFIVGYIIHNYSTMSNTTAYVRVSSAIYLADVGSFVTNGTDTYCGVCVPIKKGQSVTVQTKKSQINRVYARKILW